MLGKIMVSKQGRVLRVAVDPSSNQPLPIGGYDDEPIGAFMMTFNSPAELAAAYPGREFIYLEAPRPPENKVTPLSADMQRKVNDMMSKHGIDGTARPVTRTEVIAVESGEQLSKSDSISHEAKAHEYLKRLKVAREYASKKNQRELDTRIDAVQGLIDEVFGKS